MAPGTALPAATPSHAWPGAGGSPQASWFGALELLTFPVLVLDGQSRIMHANAAAIRCMRERNVLHIEEGVLCCRTARLDAELRAGVASACAGKRDYRTFEDRLGALHAAFVPLSSCGPDCAPLVAVLIEREEACDQLALHFFSRAVRLTQTEERLLAVIASGTGVNSAASQLDMSPNTARTHVRSILSKTGHESLRELTARLGRLPPIASRCQQSFG